jgi:hypothetical protein
MYTEPQIAHYDGLPLIAFHDSASGRMHTVHSALSAPQSSSDWERINTDVVCDPADMDLAFVEGGIPVALFALGFGRYFASGIAGSTSEAADWLTVPAQLGTGSQLEFLPFNGALATIDGEAFGGPFTCRVSVYFSGPPEVSVHYVRTASDISGPCGDVAISMVGGQLAYLFTSEADGTVRYGRQVYD